MDGELLKWGELNLDDFEDEYFDKEEGIGMLNSGLSIEKKRDPFILNIFYLYLDMCSTFNHNINKNNTWYIRKVVQGLKSHSNRCCEKYQPEKKL